jgi:peptide/nickel transport system substrate-binding protein
MKRRSFVLFTLAAVLVVVAACVPAAAPAPTAAPAAKAPAEPTKAPVEPTKAPAQPTAAPAAGGTTLRFGVGIDVSSLDPIAQNNTTIANMLSYMVETLVTFDQSGKIIPLLAKSWQTSPDGLEWVFTLQDGVKFQDGTLFDAAAVKANFDRLLDPEVTAPGRGSYTLIKSTEAVNATTVKFTLSKRSMAFLATLTWPASGIISPATIAKGSATYKAVATPVGTGRYIFKELVKGSNLTVTKNPNYWGKKPYYDTVIFRILPEAATRESQLLAGQLDVIMLPPASDLDALGKNPAVKLILAPSNRSVFIAINTTKKPWDNPKARQALNYAVNKDEIVKSILFGAGSTLDAPIAPSVFGYCKVGPYAYDPDKAKALLKEAGVAADTSVDLIYPTGRLLADAQAGQAIGAFLTQVGLKPQMSTMDWPTYIGAVTQPLTATKTTLHMLGWASSYLDASGSLETFDSRLQPPKGFNTAFYTNTRVNDLLDQALGEVDQAKRADLYCQAEKLVWEDAPWIFLWYQRFPLVHSAKIKGVGYLPNEMFTTFDAEPAQ